MATKEQTRYRSNVLSLMSHVSCEDHCIMSGKTCVDGSTFVGQNVVKAVNKIVREARANGRTFIGTTTLSVHAVPKWSASLRVRSAVT